ncbi:MAG: 2-deoxyribose-5-phosphate aldolase, partial [Bacilli bacterium]
LTNDEIERVSKLVKEAGADFVKTSTGFSKWGAKKEDVALMRKTVGPNFGVKAAGGIRTHEEMIEMIDAGATRIGTSSGKKLM